MKTPGDAQKWAVDNHYRGSNQSARIKWSQMFNGQVLPTPKMQEAIAAYIVMCLTDGKKEPVAA